MIYLIYCISFELILLRASGDYTICRRQISSLFYGFWEKHVRKGPNSANFQNLIIFNSSSNFNASLHLNIQLNELFYESVKKISYYTPVSRRAILCDWVWRASRRPHRFPHNNFSSVYWIFTKLDHMISLWKGKNPIYFGVIRSKVKVTVTINGIFDNRVVSAW